VVHFELIKNDDVGRGGPGLFAGETLDRQRACWLYSFPQRLSPLAFSFDTTPGTKLLQSAQAAKDMTRYYKKRTPRRRHILSTERRLSQTIKWLRQIAQGPSYVIVTNTWTQPERDAFIVKNNLTQIYHPDHDLDPARGILVRDLPPFLKTACDYQREQRGHRCHKPNHPIPSSQRGSPGQARERPKP